MTDTTRQSNQAALQQSLNDDLTPFMRVAQRSPYLKRNGSGGDLSRFRDELVEVVHEAAEAIKPGPGRAIDINGRYAARSRVRRLLARRVRVRPQARGSEDGDAAG